MENKNEENEDKTIIGDFNFTMNKMDRDGENKTQRLYRSCSNYALSKLILDNGLGYLWWKNPDSLSPPAMIGLPPRIHDRQTQ